MKSKLKQMMMSLMIFSVSSLVFAACSGDDDTVMGAVAINSCQYTATTVTPIWTLVPNSNCDGYIVSLYLGSRSNVGSLVEQQTLDYRTCKYTFANLTPSTNYVISTQAIPSASSGFSSAQLYWKEFTTSAE
jgi:hypothetical protein